MTSGWRKVALVLAIGLGVVVTRVFWDGRSALSEGDAAMARGDVKEAVVKWRRAARWYAPGAPHVADAYERLEALGRAADERGDLAAALDAWRAVRSSVLATRSLWTPFPEKLAAANERIAALMARQELTADATKDEAARRAMHLGFLQRDEMPSVPWSIVALAGFAMWVGGGFYFARRGVTPEDTLHRRNAIRAALLIVAGLVVWMLGLYRA